jgi:hypothetical protein
MYRTLTIILLLYMGFNACEKKTKEATVLEDTLKLPDEVFLIDLSKKVLKDLYKESKVEKTPEGIILSLEFGGTSALSFRSQESFEREMHLLTAFYGLKIIKLSSKRKVSKIILSIVKPFYVREESIKKEVIEEFEIFRVSLIPIQVKQLDNFEAAPIESISIEGKEGELQLNILNSIIKNWKVELNEIHRVEIK